jgi:predicted nucleotidyltransferase
VFIILVGSVARKDFNETSDIDICRIETKCDLKRERKWPSGPINYIDFSFDEFLHLYNSGSLFIYHVVNEGKLICGDVHKWRHLKDNFVFEDTYTGELDKIRRRFHVFLEIEIYGNKYMSLYSNLFTTVKNFSIFYLAKKRIFVFNKEIAIKTVFGDFYYDLLIASYNYFERGIINDTLNYECNDTAQEIIHYYYNKIEVLINDK